MNPIKKLNDLVEANTLFFGKKYHSFEQKKVLTTIVVSTEGRLMDAFVEEGQGTYCPLNPQTGNNRSSGIEPRPLFDNYKYVCRDYTKYDRSLFEKKAKKNKTEDEGSGGKTHNDAYLSEMKKWNESPYAHPHVKILEKCLRGTNVIERLINMGFFQVDADGYVISYISEPTENDQLIYHAASKINPKPKKGEPAPSIFNSHIRFTIRDSNGNDFPMWINEGVTQSFFDYSENNPDAIYATCSATGIYGPIGLKFSKLGKQDSLFSGNKTGDFTHVRGYNQIRKIGETKVADTFVLNQLVGSNAVNALSVLNGKKCFVSMGDGVKRYLWLQSEEGKFIEMENTKSEINELNSLLEDDFFSHHSPPEEGASCDVGQLYCDNLKKILNGYSAKINEESNVFFLDYSSNSARVFFGDSGHVKGSKFLSNVLNWYKTDSPGFFCNGKAKKKVWRAPNISEIISVINPVPNGVKKRADPYKDGYKYKIINSIIKGETFPEEIIDMHLRAYILSGDEKNLYIHNFLFNKLNKQNMKENNESDRNFLYGRILSVLDKVENIAEKIKNNGKPSGREQHTSCRRQSFFQDPFSTYMVLEELITPYWNEIKRANPKAFDFLKGEINSINNLFKDEEFESTDSLNSMSLLGFSRQDKINQDYFSK